jgi:hypothetical protein
MVNAENLEEFKKLIYFKYVFFVGIGSEVTESP